MERIWAAWRARYVTHEREDGDGGCIFEALPSLGNDREALILHRGETAFVLMNLYPYTSGHLMIAPYRHTADLQSLTDGELLEINQLVTKCVGWISTCYRPQGFNIGVNLGSAGGAGIPDHVHWHVVPRWAGDTNFMSAIGETRVLPESLQDSYDRLLAAIRA